MRQSVWVCSVAAVLLVTQLAAQTPPASEAQLFEISFGVSGNPGPEDDLNPLTIAYKKWPGRSTQVLGFINYRNPRTLPEIEKASGIPHDELEHLIADLQKCGLIVWSAATGYRVTFAVFDDELWRSFDPIMDAAAEEIAQRIVDERIRPLKAHYAQSDAQKRGMSFGSLATLVIGSFGLDETAIEELQQRDLMRVRKLQPGDRHYILLANRNQRISGIHRLYGIHSVRWGEVRYATFGENAAMNARRTEIRALPDLAWHWRDAGTKSADAADAAILPLGSIAMQFKNEWFSAAQAAKALPSGAKDALLGDWVSSGLLEQDSKGQYRAAFFVLSKEERQRFEPDVRGTADIAVQIFRSAYARFEEAYAHSAPSAQQVPMQDVMDMVYHRTYSLALQKLFTRITDFGFTEEHGPLRYTAYALLQ